MAESVRQQRVNQAILRAVSTIILKEYGGSILGSVIVSRVKVTPDLRTAYILYKTLVEESKEDIGELLKKETKHIRFMLAKEINHLKFVPDISFKYDTEIDNIMRIEEVFDKIKRENND